MFIFGGLFLLKKLVKGYKVRGSNQVIASLKLIPHLDEIGLCWNPDCSCFQFFGKASNSVLLWKPVFVVTWTLQLKNWSEKRIHYFLSRLVEKKAYLSFFSLSRFNFPAMIPLWVSKGFNVKADVFPLS